MKNSYNARSRPIMVALGLSLLLLLTLVTFIGQVLATTGSAANLENSAKVVDLAEAAAGETVQYTVFISNTGNMLVSGVFMSDTLPAEVQYQTGSLAVTAGSNYITVGSGESNGVITWTGSLGAQGYVALSFNAVLTDALAVGASVTNTAVITGTGSWLTRTASTTIVEVEPIAPQLFFPLIMIPLPPPELQLSAPVNNSQWNASWSNLGATVTYELEEANSPDFANSHIYTVGAGVTTQAIIQNNAGVYYYRVRGIINDNAGEWSLSHSVLIGQLTLSTSRVNEFNDWSVGWTSGGLGVNQYQLQESQSSNFNNATSYTVQLSRGFVLDQHDPSPNNYYCYRVRAMAGGKLGTWSNVKCVIGGYYDDFSDDSTNWAIRRQDTDDVSNLSYYQEQDGNEFFVLEINGRWDYGIASPLSLAPELPYVIESRVRFNEADNLNSYGFIFGADWDGISECPNEDFSDCFDNYYRLLVLTNGTPDQLLVQLKRIDRHEGANSGRGKTLSNFNDVFVGRPSEGFKTWRIEVHEDGRIQVYVMGNKVIDVMDTNYIHNPYFGVFAATDEYLGAEPWYDWYSVAPLPEE